MGGSKAPKHTTTTATTTATNEPPAYLRPYLISAAERAREVANIPFTSYGAPRVANPWNDPMTSVITTYRSLLDKPNYYIPYINQMQDIRNIATGRYELPTGFEDYQPLLLEMASGGRPNPFSGENPYFEGVLSRSLGDLTREYQASVAPQMAGAFARQGAFGGSAYQQAQAESQRVLGEELGRLSGGLRYEEYNAQRELEEAASNRMLQALGLAPQYATGAEGIARQRMLDMGIAAQYELEGRAGEENLLRQRLSDVERMGGIEAQYHQAILDAEYEEFLRKVAYPQYALGAYSALQDGGGGGGSGGTTTTQTPYFAPNRLGGALGGAAAGVGLAAALGTKAAGTTAATGLGLLSAGAAGPVGWGLAGLGALAGASGAF